MNRFFTVYYYSYGIISHGRKKYRSYNKYIKDLSFQFAQVILKHLVDIAFHIK